MENNVENIQTEESQEPIEETPASEALKMQTFTTSTRSP